MRHALRWAGRAALVAFLVWAGMVGVLVMQETSLVYAGADGRAEGRPLPGEGAGIPWDTIRVEADDGVPVVLLTSPLDDPEAPWMIFFHGNGGLLGSASSLARYRLLREAGFQVLAVEFRGYGVSMEAGRPTEEGVYADARAGWAHLVEGQGRDPASVYLYGWSLGGGPALYLAERYEVGGVVTEGSPTSVVDIGAEVYPWLPVRLLIRNRFENLARAPSVGAPWIVFHGRSDEVVPFAHGQALAAAGPTARLVPLAAGHDDGVVADSETALRALRTLRGER